MSRSDLAAAPAADLTPPTARWNTPSRLLAALSGLLAVAASIGVSELVSGFLAGARSLVVSVGDAVIDNVPGAVERAAISVLGRNDKPVLLATILVVCALLGAALGVLGARRFGLAATGFVAFAVMATAAALAEPQSELIPTVVVGGLAAVTGVAALRLLLRAATPLPAQPLPARPLPAQLSSAGAGAGLSGAGLSSAGAVGAGLSSAGAVGGSHVVRPARDSLDGPPAPYGTDRRTFLRAAGAAAAVAVVGAVAGRMLAARDAVTAARASVRIPLPFRTAPAAPAGASLDIAGITPLFVSNTDFYRIDTALTVPQVDPLGWTMAVTGLVDEPFTLSYDDLMAMEQVEVDVTLSCVSNEVGGDLVGNARWQGVLLRTLLERAGVQAGATQIMGHSVDGFTAGFPTEIALDGRDAIVAVAMNGEPLPVAHGFPARLVVPGLYGYVSATKWLSEIELTTLDVNGYWIPRGWSKLGPIKTQSRIDVPVAGTTIPTGPRAIAGIAWAPTRGIDGVQVKIDDADWQDATLADALGVDTWRQWVYQWDATPGVHVIAVRATDGTGETQTDVRAAPAPDGASGYHTIQLAVEA